VGEKGKNCVLTHVVSPTVGKACWCSKRGNKNQGRRKKAFVSHGIDEKPNPLPREKRTGSLLSTAQQTMMVKGNHQRAEKREKKRTGIDREKDFSRPFEGRAGIYNALKWGNWERELRRGGKAGVPKRFKGVQDG